MAHILVIDDTKNIRNLTQLTLRRAGYNVESAEDGERGLELFGDGKGWSLVLLDHQMPGMVGLDVLREIRRRDPAARIVLFTAFATIGLASDAIKAGATDFLRKPFSTDALRSTVEATLSRPRQSGRTETVEDAPAAPSKAYSFNGYQFWALPLEDSDAPPAFAVYRVFTLRGPSGESGRCTVGLTPHVQEQVHSITRKVHAPEEKLWDVVCANVLFRTLSDAPAMPPDVLPVIELTREQRDEITDLSGTARFREWG